MTVDIEYSEAMMQYADICARLSAWDVYCANERVAHIVWAIILTLVIGTIIGIFLLSLTDCFEIALGGFILVGVIIFVVVLPIWDDRLMIEYQELQSQKATLELYLQNKGIL